MAMSETDDTLVIEQTPGDARRWRRRGITEELGQTLRYREVDEVVALLGQPHTTAHLGLRRTVAYWVIKRQWVEVIFDEHGRAERITLA